MQGHDWSLTLFTLLAEMMAGGLLFLTMAKLFTNKFYKTRIFRRKLFLLFISGFCGLILAFFHLGSPIHAYNALNNLGSSWMSMEILSVSVLLFTLFLLNLYYLKLVNMHKGIIMLLNTIGIVSSIVLIYSMGRIYIEPTIESWYTPFTWFEFANAAIVLGGSLVIIGLDAKDFQSIRLFIAVIIGFMIFADLLLLQQSLQLMKTEFMYIVQVLLIASLLMTGVLVFSFPKKKNTGLLLMYLILIALFIVELFGRLSFYYSYQSIGM